MTTVATKSTDTDPFEQLLQAAGGARGLANRLGVTTQAVYDWRRQGYAPPSRAIEMERLYGVPRHLLVKPELAEFIQPSY